MAEKNCEVCNKSFHKSAHFKRHMKSHTKAQDFQCSDCGKAYADKRTLKMHVERLHPLNIKQFEKEKNIPCDLCEKLFSMKSEVEHHKVEVHNHNYFIICDCCGKGFIKKDHKIMLERHKKKCLL